VSTVPATRGSGSTVRAPRAPDMTHEGRTSPTSRRWGAGGGLCGCKRIKDHRSATSMFVSIRSHPDVVPPLGAGKSRGRDCFLSRSSASHRPVQFRTSPAAALVSQLYFLGSRSHIASQHADHEEAGSHILDIRRFARSINVSSPRIELEQQAQNWRHRNVAK
jgi:hypothetical protein